MIVLAGLIKTIFIFSWFYISYSSALFIIFNLLTSLFLVLTLRKRIQNKSHLLSLYLIDAFIPIFGFLVFIFFTLLSPLYAYLYNRDTQEEQSQKILEESEFNKYTDRTKAKIENFELDDFEQRLFQSIKIQPYIDILRGEDIDLKISACIKLSQFKTKQSIELLKIALQDKNYEVRYMSNNTLGQIEQEYLTEIESLTENIKKYPTHIDHFIQRGNLYLWIVQLGLLDQVLAEQFVKKALADYRHCLKVTAGNFHLYLRIAKCYIHLNFYDEIILLVEKAMKLSLDDEVKSKLLFYRAEAHFQQKNFDSLLTDVHQIENAHLNYEKTKEALNWWGGK